MAATPVLSHSSTIMLCLSKRLISQTVKSPLPLPLAVDSNKDTETHSQHFHYHSHPPAALKPTLSTSQTTRP